jgi:hypothetical protein
MDTRDYIVLIASILAVIGNVPYLLDIVHKRIKPHPYTWFIWTIVSGVTFFGQVAGGGGVGAIPTAASEIFTLVIFLFSLQYGFKNIARTDTYFLIAAILGLIPWFLTNDPTLSVVIVVIIDVIAFIPTIRKTFAHPDTETPILYSMNVLRHILALFSLEAVNIATSFHSVMMIMTNSIMTAIIVKKRK